MDENLVNELIAAAKLDKSTSAQTDSKITSNEVKEVIQNQVKEQNLEAKEKKRINNVNVIIFNLTESTSQLKTTKQQHDEQQILELCTEIDNNFTETDMDMRRLGKLSENTSNPRPVQIKFPNTDNKRSILRNFHRLKNNDKFGNIKIDHEKQNKKERNPKNYLKKQRDRKQLISRGNTYTESGVHHGKEK